ncbi:hypothetical protein QMK61_13210 [Fulvimonas sp. R45]|uniref:hypothetical protein n=1 Tax=Fulvimonas sp. R45 TaxID=3045937 RepID=UPI00265FC02C|nr:hypothetical protein [Fulvimonas sp. R45]MDO1529791.1 hypothetical protein [Fulvimonas sp. R45]
MELGLAADLLAHDDDGALAPPDELGLPGQVVACIGIGRDRGGSRHAVEIGLGMVLAAGALLLDGAIAHGSLDRLDGRGGLEFPLSLGGSSVHSAARCWASWFSSMAMPVASSKLDSADL